MTQPFLAVGADYWTGSSGSGMDNFTILVILVLSKCLVLVRLNYSADNPRTVYLNGYSNFRSQRERDQDRVLEWKVRSTVQSS